MERCAVCDQVVELDEAHVHARCHAKATGDLCDEIERLKAELKKAKLQAEGWKRKARIYYERLTLLGVAKDDGWSQDAFYHRLFDYYNSLDLVKHRKLTKEMRSAIDIARRRGGYTWDELAKLLYRHSMIVKLSSGDGEYAVRSRGIAEFFGQKVKDGTCLICSEYADDGAKWLRYQAGWKKYLQTETKHLAFDRPTGNYDQLALDPFVDEGGTQ